MLCYLMQTKLSSIGAELEKVLHKGVEMIELNDMEKGPVKLIRRVKIARSSFIFTVRVKSVPLYHLKLSSSTCGCKRIFRNPLLEMEKVAVSILRVLFDRP